MDIAVSLFPDSLFPALHRHYSHHYYHRNRLLKPLCLDSAQLSCDSTIPTGLSKYSVFSYSSTSIADLEQDRCRNHSCRVDMSFGGTTSHSDVGRNGQSDLCSFCHQGLFGLDIGKNISGHHPAGGEQCATQGQVETVFFGTREHVGGSLVCLDHQLQQVLPVS